MAYSEETQCISYGQHRFGAECHVSALGILPIKNQAATSIALLADIPPELWPALMVWLYKWKKHQNFSLIVKNEIIKGLCVTALCSRMSKSMSWTLCLPE